MVTLNYYHNKSEKYVTGNRNNYLHCLACMYNRYGVPQEEAAAFIKSQFTDLPADEMDALIGSAYGHNEEFDTRKLNSTQKRILQIEQHIKENYDTRYNEVLHIMEYRRRKNGHGATGTFPYSRRNDGKQHLDGDERTGLFVHRQDDSESDLLRLQQHLPSYSRVFRLAA